MYAVSSAFLTALRSASMTTVVQVTTSTGLTLAFRDGSVTMDSRRNIGRTASLEFVPDGTYSAKQIYDILMTPNVEITIRRGLILADGSTELIPLGVFSTDTAEYSRSVAGAVNWSGSDRSKKIARARFTDPYQITSGTSLASAGSNLLSTRWPGVASDFSNVLDNITAPVIFDAGDQSDPWDCARKLFADYGYDLSFNGIGTARAIQVPDPSTSTPVFDFGANATNLILDATVTGTLEKTYNGVIVTGEGTSLSSPIRAEVWDTDPLSPTYYLGGYGKVPLFYSSPLITSSVIANAFATVLLSKLKGKSEQLAWNNVVNPALEPLDVVTITLGGTTQNVVLDQLVIPLRSSEPMTANARHTS